MGGIIIILNAEVSAFSILESLESLSTKAFNYFYKNKDLTPYLQELCKLQALDYRIIPVSEPIGLYKTNIKESFIFTIQRANVIYLIWESVEEKKATFLFTTDLSEYQKDLQSIFDYISSQLKNKRTNLRQGISNDEGYKLRSHRTFYHTALDKWKEKLFESLI